MQNNMVQLLVICAYVYLGLAQVRGEQKNNMDTMPNVTVPGKNESIMENMYDDIMWTTQSPNISTEFSSNSSFNVSSIPNISKYVDFNASNENGAYGALPLSVSNDEKVAWAIMLSLIGVVGTVGNGLQLIFCLTKRRNILHVLLANMALADILLCAIYVPFYVYSMLQQEWHIDGKICTALGYLYIFLNPISIWNHVILLAYCLLITSDNNLNKRYKWTTALMLCVLGEWMVSLFSILLTPYLGSNDIDIKYDPTRCNCRDESLSYPNNHLTTRVGVSLITLLPISVATCMIIHVLCKIGQTKHIGPPGGGAPPTSFSVLQRTMASAVAFFTLCLLPDWICMTVDPAQESLPGSLHRASAFFMLAKGIIGPFLTLLVVKEFRHSLLFCCGSRKMYDESGPFKIPESINLKTVDIKGIEEELGGHFKYQSEETCHI